MNSKEILRDTLFAEITRVQQILDSARSCLKDDDFSQCAVRLQMSGVKFTELEIALIDEITSE